VLGSGTGISMKAWRTSPMEPRPVIQPLSLMLFAVSNTQPESGSISEFKSVHVESLYKNWGLLECSPNHLAAGVDSCPASWPKVGHRTATVKEHVLRTRNGKRIASDLSTIINPECLGAPAAKRAEVGDGVLNGTECRQSKGKYQYRRFVFGSHIESPERSFQMVDSPRHPKGA
jgi:hypothetical protein